MKGGSIKVEAFPIMCSAKLKHPHHVISFFPFWLHTSVHYKRRLSMSSSPSLMMMADCSTHSSVEENPAWMTPTHELTIVSGDGFGKREGSHGFGVVSFAVTVSIKSGQ